MNLRVVGKYIGYLALAEGGFMLPSALVAMLYGESDAALALMAGAACAFLMALVLFLFCRKEQAAIYPREGMMVAGAGWVMLSVLGALPFVFSGEIPHFIDAFFETVSGFTTTGASILTQVEAMSHGMLFWRSFTHWLGGIGILVFLLAVVPRQGGGSALQLMRAESPGPQVGKMLPKTRSSVRILLLIYLSLSVVNLIFLLIGRMPLFDALCTMFGTAGTGGFGIKGDSMASYSLFAQNVTTVFMLIFGANFSLYFLVLLKDWKTALKDEELRLYLGIAVAAIAFITLNRAFSGGVGLSANVQQSAFTVASIMSTSGFAVTDFDLWPQFSRALIMVLMIFGAMAGSTAGGFKMSRVLILFKAALAGIHRLTHPRSVRAVQLNKKTLDKAVIVNVYLFLSVYCFFALLCFLLLSLDTMDTETNLSAMLTCFNNVGPGLGAVGPARNFAGYSVFSKAVLSVAMLLGRLEIFPIMLMFAPSTWRRKR